MDTSKEVKKQGWLKAFSGMEAKQHADSTTANYKGKIRALENWLKVFGSEDEFTEGGSIKCPLPEELLKMFFGFLIVGDGTNADQEEDVEVDEHVDDDEADEPPEHSDLREAAEKVGIPKLAISTLGSYASAITHMYSKWRPEIVNPSVFPILKAAIKGVERTFATHRLEGRLPTHEGKLPIAFEGYFIVARYSLSDKELVLASSEPSQDPSPPLPDPVPSSAVSGGQKKKAAKKRKMAPAVSVACTFAHLYGILCWNLCARSISAGSLMFEHLAWVGDSLTVVYAKSKCDQEGANKYVIHVYANPINPFICPILALAIHVFTMGFRAAGGHNLPIFENCRTATARFSKWLTVLQEKLERCNILVLKAAEGSSEAASGKKKASNSIGTHSFR